MSSNIITERFLTIRCRAFTGEGIRDHRIMVSPDVVDGGTIRVWDDVAGHYTTCHALSKSTMRKIRRMSSSLGNHADHQQAKVLAR